jgi:hypothetical protein
MRSQIQWVVWNNSADKHLAHDLVCDSRDAQRHWRSKHAAQDNVCYARHCAHVFVLRVDIFATIAESTRPSRLVHSILDRVRVAYADGPFTVGFRFANAENRGAKNAKNLARKAFPN